MGLLIIKGIPLFPEHQVSNFPIKNFPYRNINHYFNTDFNGRFKRWVYYTGLQAESFSSFASKCEVRVQVSVDEYPSLLLVSSIFTKKWITPTLIE